MPSCCPTPCGLTLKLGKSSGVDCKGNGRRHSANERLGSGNGGSGRGGRPASIFRVAGSLRDVGVPEEGLELIAAATLHDRALATNPTPVSDAGPIMSILRSSW